MLLGGQSSFDLAVRFRSEGASLAEVYAFISGLYFRGKLAYSEAFAAPPEGVPASAIITPGSGMMPPGARLTHDQLHALGQISIDEDEPLYRAPLERDARALAESIGPECQIVLLGSIASAKYMDPLLECFGDRLVFPQEFVGRGDMSRGGLMLRAASEGRELVYVPARGAVRTGRRPPKLPKLVR